MSTLNTLKVIAESVILSKGLNKEGKAYYFFEVVEPTRKFINADKAGDIAILEKLASSGQSVDLVLEQRGQSLVFSANNNSF